jgi:hypothetical protein
MWLSNHGGETEEYVDTGRGGAGNSKTDRFSKRRKVLKLRTSIWPINGRLNSPLDAFFRALLADIFASSAEVLKCGK